MVAKLSICECTDAFHLHVATILARHASPGTAITSATRFLSQLEAGGWFEEPERAKRPAARFHSISGQSTGDQAGNFTSKSSAGQIVKNLPCNFEHGIQGSIEVPCDLQIFHQHRFDYELKKVSNLVMLLQLQRETFF